MQNAWRVIDCTSMQGNLSYARGRLRIASDSSDSVVDIPLAETAVLLLGLKIRWSTALIHQLAEFEVAVLICDWRGVPIAALHQWTKTFTNITARHRAQVEMSLPRRKNAWARIIEKKIRGQATCLEALSCDGSKTLRELAKTVRSGDPSNVEGHAARLYWQSLFPDEKFFRRPHEGTGGRNAVFDYAYMVLRGFAIKAVISAGLAPMFGVGHRNAGNYYCLVDDIIEPFRPAVDFGVAQLPSTVSLSDPEVKSALVAAVNRGFDSSGFTIPSMLSKFAQQYGLYCEGKQKRLPVPEFEVVPHET